MKILFFLWNPGLQYEQTKHNIWFLMGDQLAHAWDCPERSLDKQSKALITSTNKYHQKVLLVKPQTFMNLSGQTVASLLWYYKLTPADIVVVHDDIDLPSGTIRRKQGWSAGGQNGLKDIITKIGTQDFGRIRIGIGRPSHPSADIADYVLSHIDNTTKGQLPFYKEQMQDKLDHHFFIK